MQSGSLSRMAGCPRIRFERLDKIVQIRRDPYDDRFIAACYGLPYENALRRMWKLRRSCMQVRSEIHPSHRVCCRGDPASPGGRIAGNGVRTVIVEDAMWFARERMTQELRIASPIKVGVRVVTRRTRRA
jgi:hypothetical protein